MTCPDINVGVSLSEEPEAGGISLFWEDSNIFPHENKLVTRIQQYLLGEMYIHLLGIVHLLSGIN